MNHQENHLTASAVPTERELAYRRRRAAPLDLAADTDRVAQLADALAA